MEEAKEVWKAPADPGHALLLSKASFSWEAPPKPRHRPRPPKKEPSSPDVTVAEMNANKHVLVTEDVDADACTEEAEEGREGNQMGLLSDHHRTSSRTPTPVLRDVSLVVPKVVQSFCQVSHQCSVLPWVWCLSPIDQLRDRCSPAIT